MANYEIIREIFNQCSGNQMRDVSITEEAVDDVDAYMDRYRLGCNLQEERTEAADGSIIYDLVADGLKQRVTFQEV